MFESNPNNKKKYFVTFPFPYINGAPHIGHAYTQLRCDLMARFKRLNGYNVLFPLGLHATGEPIVGAAKRIAKGEKKLVDSFKLYGLSDEEIKEFSDPKMMATFFGEQWIEATKLFQLSIDYRRTFKTIDKAYNKFVEWQYNHLKKKGLITKGSHPVIWCPSDQSPTGEHDRLEGENATIVEYQIIKFKTENDIYFPCATLRPETIFGVTNIWVNPKAEYMKAIVNGEEWVLTEDTIIKLQEQNREVIPKERVNGRELVGFIVENPITHEKIEVLPATFVDTKIGTGVVMSVPSHAPFDYIALRDLKFEFEPKNLIKTEGLPENPGIALVEKEGIKNQEEKEKLEQITKHIYKMEFHKGVLTNECKPFEGRNVKDVKKDLVDTFERLRLMEKLHELSEPVVCRCTTPNYVKLIKDQWFLKYSDKKWKRKAQQCLEQMRIYPEEARNLMRNAIEGMEDKACARKSGMGTQMPWDDAWIIEPLSDSTIYMSFYIIQKYLTEGKIKEENLNSKFFDYVLLGKGSAKNKLWKQAHDEFEYYYPVDLRVSGKDLLAHHLPFFIYHHTAFFNKKKWPRAIGANGFVTVEGEKMSKSKGNFLPLKSVITDYGADAVRLALLDTAEGLDDPNFSRTTATSFKKKISNAIKTEETVKKKMGGAEKLLLSRMQGIIEKTTNHLNNMENRQALNQAFHQMNNSLTDYYNMVYQADEQTITNFYNMWAVLINPFAPEFSEKILPKVYENNWPVVNKKLVNKNVENLYGIISNFVEDVERIKKITGKKGEEVKVIISEDWKYNFYDSLRKSMKKSREFKKIFDEVKIKGREKEISQIIQNALKDEKKIPELILSPKNEAKAFREFEDYLKKKGIFTVIEFADKSSEQKKGNAIPSKPAIILIK